MWNLSSSYTWSVLLQLIQVCFVIVCLGNVLSIKIYDPTSQTGENACSINRGNCSHLCLPVSATNRVCRCATGYYTHTTDPTRCVGECLYQMEFQTNETKNLQKIKPFLSFKEFIISQKDYYNIMILSIPHWIESF